MRRIIENFKQLKRGNRNISLHQSLSLHILIGVFAVLICYGITLIWCNSWHDLILGRYLAFDQYPADFVDSFQGYTVSRQDLPILSFIEFLKVASIFIYTFLATFLISRAFIKNKIEEPLRIIRYASQKIAENDLDVICQYESRDEMGDIIEIMNGMRTRLIQNYESLWKMTDDQRHLNAAFAHDLRTPLTVMQGNIEMLYKYHGLGRLSEEQLMCSLKNIEAQVHRLKRFSETMNKIQSWDHLEPKLSLHSLEDTLAKIKVIVNTYSIPDPIQVHFSFGALPVSSYYDEHLILEVFENLLSNAVQYAASLIKITVDLHHDQLGLYVQDDGHGFTDEELFMAKNPYYSSRKEGGEHFGIGLTICKHLCDKHHGSLTLHNSIQGGAIVCGSFRLVEKI